MASSHFYFLTLVVLINLTSIHVSADLIFEDGYTVTTVINGYKLGINPHSVFSKSGSSDLIVLDSSGSTFYTLSFSSSQEGVIKQLSGNGKPGYSDGDSGSATFDRPKSFALDFNGNVYVADKNNHAVRKISKSGVTTIAGGYSQKPGHADGPARNASFSDDFELAFIPERCALMISDHGNKLVRQINLKGEDCAKGSQSVLGMVSAWSLGLGVACLLGLIVGFAIRPYIVPHEGSSPLHFSKTWKHCLIRLGRQVLIFCFDIRSAIVSSTLYALLRRLVMLALSHLSLMSRLSILESKTSISSFSRDKSVVSLLDCDDLSSSEITNSQMLADQLKDLVSLDGSLDLSGTTNQILEQADENKETSNLLSDSREKVDSMIHANILSFTEQAKRTTLVEYLECSSGLIKRR